MPNVYVHNVVSANPRVAPHRLKDLAPAEYDAGACRQRNEHIELGSSQQDGRFIDERLATVHVYL
jgi:hypothetical protein